MGRISEYGKNQEKDSIQPCFKPFTLKLTLNTHFQALDRVRNHPPPPHRPYNSNSSEREWLSSDVDSIRRASYDFIPQHQQQQQRTTRGATSNNRPLPPAYSHAAHYNGSKTLPHQRPNVKWVIDRPNDDAIEATNLPSSSITSDVETFGSEDDHVSSSSCVRTANTTTDPHFGTSHGPFPHEDDYDYSDSASTGDLIRVDNKYSNNVVGDDDNSRKPSHESYYENTTTSNQHQQEQQVQQQQQENLRLLRTTRTPGRRSPQSDIATTATAERRTIYDNERYSDVSVGGIRRDHHSNCDDDLLNNSGKDNSWRQPDRPNFLDLAATPSSLSNPVDHAAHRHHPKSSRISPRSNYARSEGSSTPLMTGNPSLCDSYPDKTPKPYSSDLPNTNHHQAPTIYEDDVNRFVNPVKSNNIEQFSNNSNTNNRDVHYSDKSRSLTVDRNSTANIATRTFTSPLTGAYQPALETNTATAVTTKPFSRRTDNGVNNDISVSAAAGTPKTIYDGMEQTPATIKTTHTTEQETDSVADGPISASEMIRRLNNKNNLKTVTVGGLPNKIQPDQRDRSSSAGSVKNDSNPQQQRLQQLQQQNPVMNAPKRFEAKTIQRASSKAKDIAAKFNKTLTLQQQQVPLNQQQQHSTASVKTTENTLQRLTNEGKISARCPKCKWRKVEEEGAYCTECRAEYLVSLKQRVACGDSQERNTHASSQQQQQQHENKVSNKFKCAQCGRRLVEKVDDYCDHCESEYL